MLTNKPFNNLNILSFFFIYFTFITNLITVLFFFKKIYRWVFLTEFFKTSTKRLLISHSEQIIEKHFNNTSCEESFLRRRKLRMTLLSGAVSECDLVGLYAPHRQRNYSCLPTFFNYRRPRLRRWGSYGSWVGWLLLSVTTSYLWYLICVRFWWYLSQCSCQFYSSLISCMVYEALI